MNDNVISWAWIQIIKDQGICVIVISRSVWFSIEGRTLSPKRWIFERANAWSLHERWNQLPSCEIKGGTVGKNWMKSNGRRQTRGEREKIISLFFYVFLQSTQKTLLVSIISLVVASGQLEWSFHNWKSLVVQTEAMKFIFNWRSTSMHLDPSENLRLANQLYMRPIKRYPGATLTCVLTWMNMNILVTLSKKEKSS